MLFFEKENVFMCLVEFQKIFRKIFSGVWLCSWKYYRKHIFYLLVTFSRLPNEYIISFIPQYRNTNKTQKKIIKSKHFARSRSAGRRDRDWRGASHNRDRDCTNRWSRLREGRRFRQTISAIEALDDLGELFFLSLSRSPSPFGTGSDRRSTAPIAIAAARRAISASPPPHDLAPR